MRRLMGFIDGTNLLTEMSKAIDVPFSPYNPSEPVIRLAGMIINVLVHSRLEIVKVCPDVVVHRLHWFSSHQGSEETMNQLRTWLRRSGFEPTLLKKSKDKGEKGVDIALTREMLVNAFYRNYEIGLLVSGDEDYVGLVQDVKRFGPVVYGSFFESGLCPELKLCFDHFEMLAVWGNGHKELVQEIARLHRNSK